jgi:glycosyltransferase involved in cell wall biosynthesis
MAVSQGERPTVLVLLGCFRAGHEATGPNQSMVGMAEVLGEQFRFRVVADEGHPQSEGWTRVAGVEQLPLRRGGFGAKGLLATLRSTPHDLLVLNGFFDRQLTIPALAMRRLRLVPRKPVLLAPRGEFSPGALSLNSFKKALYLRAARGLGLLRGAFFQGTSEEEAERIRAGLGPGTQVLVGPNVRAVPPLPPRRARLPGEPLRVAFLGRITPVKNLDFALEALAAVSAPVRFHIYGPPDDAAYWRRCQAMAASLPPHVQVWHGGVLPQSEVLASMAAYDLMFLPTRGENFGHAIFEALAAGTPVLISDQTPWRELERCKAGWELPLVDARSFARAIDRAAAWAPDEAARFSAGARALAQASLATETAAAKLAICLRRAIASPVV